MESKRPVTFEDLWRLKFVGDPELAPDGSKVVWVQTETNADKNTYESAIWMSARDAGGCFGEMCIRDREEEGLFHRHPLNGVFAL